MNWKNMLHTWVETIKKLNKRRSSNIWKDQAEKSVSTKSRLSSGLQHNHKMNWAFPAYLDNLTTFKQLRKWNKVGFVRPASSPDDKRR